MATNIKPLSWIFFLLVSFSFGIDTPSWASGVPVTLSDVPVTFRAVGSVRPTTEASVMAQASGRILSMHVVEGQFVEQGSILARIGDRELTLRLSQAQRSVEEAEARHQGARSSRVAALAVLAQARAEFERTEKLLERGATTPQNMEQVRASYEQAKAALTGAEESIKAAEAAVRRTRDSVDEVRVTLEHTKTTAPFAGTATERLVEPGDLAWPGRPLVRIKSPSYRFEAAVREGLAGRVALGQRLIVTVDAIDESLPGEVVEIVPVVDRATRTFTIKLDIPAKAGLLPGMFGRLDIPVGERPALVIPSGAVRRSGQLHIVTVITTDGPRTRLVRVGEDFDGGVEILSGLTAGERILIEREEARR